MIFEQLHQFRQSLYRLLGKAKDAMFDLMDAVLVSASIALFVSLSQSPVFRRQWPSVYAALHDSRIPEGKVKRALVKQVRSEGQPILVGDGTPWHRSDAPTLRERALEGRKGQAFASFWWRLPLPPKPPNLAENPPIEPKENARPPDLTIQR